jgi:hypothetical protein
MRESGNVSKMDRISVQTCAKDRNFYSEFSILLEDEGQYNALRQKAVQ